MASIKRKTSPKSPRNKLAEALVAVYAINDAMNQVILKHLHHRAWRAIPPGGSRQAGRTIAAIFAHLHNCRLVWIRESAPHLKCPAALDPDRCTVQQAARAHKKSSRQCLAMLKDALSDTPRRRVEKFNRGSWAPVWPADGAMFPYIFAHEAHHRGQIIMLTHQLGYRLPDEAAYASWQWNKLWKQEGVPRPW